MRLRPELRPRTPQGSLQRSPDSLAGFRGPLRGGEGEWGKEGRGGEKNGKGGEGKGRGKEGEGV